MYADRINSVPLVISATLVSRGEVEYVSPVSLQAELAMRSSLPKTAESNSEIVTAMVYTLGILKLFPHQPSLVL
jgi:hypothetical protein